MKKYISFNNQLKEVKKFNLIEESNKDLLIDAYSSLLSQSDAIKNTIHTNLVTILEQIQSHEPSDQVFSITVLNKLLRNVAHVLKDNEQSNVPKQIIAEHIEEMYMLLKEMGLVKKSFLTTTSGKDIVSEFDRISKDIKQGLDELKSDKSLTWNVRQFNLWAWCNVMARKTAAPVYSELLHETKQNLELHNEIKSKFQTLFDIETQLIVEIAIGDDAADNLSYENLTNVLIQIPFSTLEIRNAEREKLSSFMNGLFVDYFDLGVEIWDDAIEKFKGLIGENKYSEIESELREHYVQIMDSMRYSVVLNTRPEGTSADPVNLVAVDEKLPPNMMVRSFRFMENVLANVICEEKGIKLPSCTEKNQELVDLSQLTASWSNSFATIYRELKENDISNVLLISANVELGQHLQRKPFVENKTKLEHDFTQFCEHRGYVNHFFAESEPPETFLELILYRNEITRDIYSVSHTLKESYIAVEGRPPLTGDIFDDAELIGKTLFYAYTGEDLSSFETLDATNKFINSLEAVQTTEKRELKRLYRRVRHIQLVDDYAKDILKKFEITQNYISKWQDNISDMKSIANSFSGQAQVSALEYVHSWELFMAMYLIFKHKPEGHI